MVGENDVREVKSYELRIMSCGLSGFGLFAVRE